MSISFRSTECHFGSSVSRGRKRPQSVTFGVLAIFLLSFTAPATRAEPEEPPSWKVAEQLNLIPTPRQPSLGDRQLPIERFHIVRSPDERLARTAADEINRRIEDLGGEKLTLASDVESGPAIILATASSDLGRRFADEVNVSETVPGEQGYAIEVVQHEDRPLVLALGSDKYGALYAGMP